MDIEKLGFCGLKCDTCPMFIARVNNDDELRQRTLVEWSALYAEYLGEKPLTKDDMNCNGCRAEQPLFIGCRNCPVRECCRSRGFDTCATCDEYQTCKMLNGFFSEPLNQPAKDNLDRIRAGK